MNKTMFVWTLGKLLVGEAEAVIECVWSRSVVCRNIGSSPNGSVDIGRDNR